MATCLVTGGAGFMGSHVAQELLNKGDTVVIIDDMSGGFTQNVPKGAIVVEGSITDHELIDKVFAQHSFDYVFHLAAYAAENLSHFIKRFNYNNNVIGSINLINASVNHNVKCFVFTSSIAVYGENKLPMTEDLVPNPEDSYGIAKYAVELELAITNKLFGLNYVVFRSHNVYGEHRNIGDKYRNVLGIFMNQIMQDQPITIFGDGKQTRAFTYIGDIAPIIAQSATTKKAHNQVFNLGADKFYTVNEAAEIVFEAMGKKTEIKHLKERKEVKHAHSSHEKLRSVFGDVSETPLAEGVKKMVIWAKQVGARKSQEFDDIEIEQNLPEGWSKR